MGEVCTDIDDKGIATVTFSNIARMNAMQLGMWQSLAQTMTRLSADESVRVVILRGEGDAAFVSGADISEFESVRSTPDAVTYYDACVEQAEVAIGACSKPVIAAISGVCYGGGVGIAVSCDLRYASLDCRFAVPAGKLGLGYPLEDVTRLYRILGRAGVAELLLTARVYRGAEAREVGLVHACVEDVFAHARAQAEAIAALAPLTLTSVKMALQNLDQVPHAPDIESVAAAVTRCFESEDYVEGRRAFAQKRSPVFRGK
ncbi:enoyl-CoA hydratase [Orrella daihaiensis]|uniref:Enoyl-CoA hydratase/isomerase family protein n=1 Tax=Orrella daihaiensis TaxID=2782176 RepID=A0ABY4ALE1_9BURK|nr:enoyl-CoA hydratase [Orrella daihaiensis]UOD51087.1 enoyl-CoA hydratase/isomerase family protein [Orrella daihaiensis]